MKTFREYLEGREVNESFLRNAALGLGAAGAAMGFGGGGVANAQSRETPAISKPQPDRNIQARNPDQKKLARIINKIDQADTDYNHADNEIKKLIDGSYDKLLMKTNFTDEEEKVVDYLKSLISRNTSVALKILKEKHYTDSNFNKKLDLNDPVVKLVFKIHPEFKKAMQEGGKNWMQSTAPGAQYDIDMKRHRYEVQSGFGGAGIDWDEILDGQ
jgi:hypothetical protein